MEKTAWIICHSHVDPIWKLRSAEYAEILGDVYLKVFDLMERYPEYKYVIDQAFLVENWLILNPDKLAKLKTFIKNMRIEVVGGVLCTADVNIPCGESIIRNILYGKKWFRENLGVDTIKTAWLVDDFGFSAQMPQILKKSGFDSLVVTRYPERPATLRDDRFDNLFEAVGIDGSTIMVSGRMALQFLVNWDDVDKLFEKAKTYLAKYENIWVFAYVENEFLPSVRVIEKVQQLNSSSRERYQFGLSKDFFRAVRKEGSVIRRRSADFNPVFSGCYTTRSSLKRTNRFLENQLLQLERFMVCNLGLDFYHYHHTRLTDLWKKLIFNQFHDAIGGCNTALVFGELKDRYSEIEKILVSLRNKVYNSISSVTKDGFHGELIAVWNGMGHERSDLCRISSPEEGLNVVDLKDNSQVPTRRDNRELAFLVRDVPALAWQFYEIHKNSGDNKKEFFVESRPNEGEACTIGNDYYKIDCDWVGGLRQITLKKTGEHLLSDYGNQIVVREDRGTAWFEKFSGYTLKQSDGKIEELYTCKDSLGQTVLIKGYFPRLPWCAAKAELHYVQRVLLFDHFDRIDFETEIQWYGRATKIQISFPTPLYNGQAFFEIPFGVVGRQPYGLNPTSREDWPAQRFVLVQGERAGLAVFNEGHPGFRVQNGDIRMSILRSPPTTMWGLTPDETMYENGEHLIRYSVIGFSGRWDEARIPLKAASYNLSLLPLIFSQKTQQLSFLQNSFFKIEKNNILLSCLKRAEENPEEIVIRLYEAVGKETDTSLVFKDKLRGIWSADLLEKRMQKVKFNGRSVKLHFDPFEIKTLKILYSV